MLKPGDIVYTSGPMTGMPDNNQALFDEIEEVLVERGLRVINPCELGRTDGEVLEGDGWSATDEEYEGFLERDMDHVAASDAVVLIPGWEKSGGAGREGRHAIELGKPLYVIIQYDEQWSTLIPFPNDLFLKYSTTERLRPSAA